jgi:hypothetical protein
MLKFEEYNEIYTLAVRALDTLDSPLQEETDDNPLVALTNIFSEVPKVVTSPLWLALTRFLSKVTLDIPKTDDDLLKVLFGFCKTNTALFKNSKDGSQVFSLAPDIMLTVKGNLETAKDYSQVTIMLNGNQKTTVKNFTAFIDQIIKMRIKNNLKSAWDELNPKLKRVLIPKILTK